MLHYISEGILYFVLHFVYLMDFVTSLTEWVLFIQNYTHKQNMIFVMDWSAAALKMRIHRCSNYNQMFKYEIFIGTFGSFNSHTLYFYLLWVAPPPRVWRYRSYVCKSVIISCVTFALQGLNHWILNEHFTQKCKRSHLLLLMI